MEILTDWLIENIVLLLGALGLGGAGGLLGDKLADKRQDVAIEKIKADLVEMRGDHNTNSSNDENLKSRVELMAKEQRELNREVKAMIRDQKEDNKDMIRELNKALQQQGTNFTEMVNNIGNKCTESMIRFYEKK